MDKKWMREPRHSKTYIEGMKYMLDLFYTYTPNDQKCPCPCKKCVNIKMWDRDEVEGHLVWNGIMENYTEWIYHDGRLSNAVSRPNDISSFTTNSIDNNDNSVNPMDKVIKMQRNEYGQFVGDGQVQLSSFMGTLVRTRPLFPMTPLSWTHVSNFSKNTAWKLIKQRFDVYESDKKHIMHLLGKRYKDNKSKFKSLFYRPLDTPEAVIARGGPKSMPISEFVDMVTYWYSPKGKSICEKNKACRSNQIGTHALGRTSLANRRKELTTELGKEPTPLELYVNSRTSKAKDNILADDYALAKKAALEKAVDEQMSQCPLDTPIGEIHEAAFRSTFGPEYYGRCRSMGSGVTSIQVFPDLSCRSKTSGMSHTNSREMREIDQLKQQMMNMQKTIDFLVNDMSHHGSREDCSGTSAGPRVFLSTDQLARMMNSVSRPNQNSESAPNDTPPTEPNTRIHPEQGAQGEN